MAIRVEHDVHRRRWSRNLGLGLVLLALIAVMFGLTVAKISGSQKVEAVDHVARPQLLEPKQ